MERIFFFGGIATVTAGFAVILYQGISFLKGGVWNSLPLLSVIDTETSGIGQSIAANPTLMNILQKCPLSAAIIFFGLLLLWLAGRLRNRYA